LGIITLLTDFGIKDSYVAEMKGVILKMYPEAVIVDISHEITKYDIEEGAYHLSRAVRYFPDGTIHIGVVDPGVGGPRKPLIIETRGGILVGPDNGLLAPAAERLGIKHIYEITRMDLLPRRLSDVFHGRDIFAPTAALLAQGLKPLDLGSEILEYQRLTLYTVKVENKQIQARVIHVDGFGNLVTNITQENLEEAGINLESPTEIKIGSSVYRMSFVRTFSSVPIGDFLLLIAGGGYLVISQNQGNISNKLNIEKGVEVTLSAL
jgi:hypothetical protein